MTQSYKKTMKDTLFFFKSFHFATSLFRNLLIFKFYFVNLLKGKNKTVIHNDLSFKFYAPNPITMWRYDTFSSKEPETLEWIDKIPNNSTFWDIGANVGMYSIYAAKKSKCKVWAFEPSVFNLELLARNIFLNKLTKDICIVPLPITYKTGENYMRFTSTEWGGALSVFGESYGWDGKKIRNIFDSNTVGISMSDAINLFKIPIPDYIKIDVDGIEHLILIGGQDVLKQTKSVLIEVNDAFYEQSKKCKKLLTKAGLKLSEKRQSELVSKSSGKFIHTFNQIWVRP